MKKLNKKAKIILSTSLAVATLVPLVSVAATSCSATAETNNATPVNFNQANVTSLVAQHTNDYWLEPSNKAELQKNVAENLSITDKNLTLDQKLALIQDLNITNSNNQGNGINITIWLNPDYKFSNGTAELVLNNTQTLQWTNVTFNQDKFIDTTSPLAYDLLNTPNKLAHYFVTAGGLSAQSFDPDQIQITPQPAQTDGNLTIKVTVPLKNGYRVLHGNGQYSTQIVVYVTTNTISQTVDFDQVNFCKAVNKLSLADVDTPAEVQVLLNKYGLTNEMAPVQNINVTSVAHEVGQKQSINVTVQLAFGYLYNNSQVIRLTNIATTTLTTAEVSFEKSNFISYVQTITTTQAQNQQTLEAALNNYGLAQGQIQKISVTPHEAAKYGEADTVDVVINLAPGYLYNKQTTITLNNLATATVKSIPNYWVSSLLSNSTNDLSNMQVATAPVALITNKTLTNANVNELGLKGTKGLVDKKTAEQSPMLANIFKQFLGSISIDHSIKNELSYNFYQKFIQLVYATGINSANLNPNNTFMVNNLTFAKNSEGQTTVSGKIGFEYFNQGNTTLTITPNAPLLNNSDYINVNPGQVFGACYEFNNSVLAPKIYFDDSQIIGGTQTNTNPNGQPLGNAMLGYDLTNVNVYSISGTPNNKATTNAENDVTNTEVEKATTILPFAKNTKLIKVELPDVLNQNANDYYTEQPEFNKYLQSLSKEVITNQLNTQDDKIWNFVNIMANNVQIIFNDLGNDVTLDQFFHDLQIPVATSVAQFTHSELLGQLAGGIFSKEPVMTYIKNNEQNFMTVFKQFKTMIINNPEYYEQLMNKINSLIGDKLNPIKQKLGLMGASFVQLAVTQANKPTAPTKENLGNEFVNIIKSFAKGPELKKLAQQLYNEIQTESLGEILGTQLQPLLGQILQAAKSQYSNTTAYQFLDAVNNLIAGLEKMQGVTDLKDFRVLDIFKNQNQANAVVNFLKTSVVALLGAISPEKQKAFETKTLPLIEIAVNAMFELHMNDLPLLFKTLAHPIIDGQPSTIVEFFKQCVKFTKTVSVTAYDAQTHKVSFTNKMQFDIIKTATFNLQPIYDLIQNDTLGQIMVIANKVLKLGLTGDNFGTKAFIQAVMKKYNLPSAISMALGYLPVSSPNDEVWTLTLGRILKGAEFGLYQGESVQEEQLAENVVVNPTVKFNKFTWWVNANMQLRLQLLQTGQKFFLPMANNLANFFDVWKNQQYANEWWPYIGWTLNNNIVQILHTTPEQMLNTYANTTYNFATGWVNQINTPGQTENVYNYVPKVQNADYKVIAYKITDNKSPNYNEIQTILRGFNKSSALYGQYIPTDSSVIDEKLLPLIINEQSTPWLQNAIEAYKPTLLIQYNPTREVDINIDVSGLFNKSIPISIPGGYVVQVKFPMEVPVSYDNGQTYTMTNTITVKLAV
ncbi:hypothetical protein [Ureaplasma ceti]|uniref:Lipoprotein n=1 Tax=Ureaplasma ceti TaxID=3119530 RepID=A0ABP9U517_9BACT